MPIQPGIPRSRFLPDRLPPYTRRPPIGPERRPSGPDPDASLVQRMQAGQQRTEVDLAALRTRVLELEDMIGTLVAKVNELLGAVGVVDDTLSRRLNEILISGALADRPTAEVTDRLYWATDQSSGARLYYDTGSAWQVA